MVSQKLFEAYPSFPDVPTANVPKFSLTRLSSRDAAHGHDMFETCRTTGFFLLEMGGDELGDVMLKEIDAVFDTSKTFFDLEIKEKAKYAQNASKGNFTGCVTFKNV